MRHRRHLVRIDVRQAIGIVEDDQVDVARVVQLAGAQFAHAEDDQAGAVLRRPRIRQSQGATAGGVGEQEGRRAVERAFRERRQGAGHLLDGPDLADIGDGAGQRDTALGDAQGGRRAAILDRRLRRFRHVAHHLVDQRRRSPFQQRQGKRRFAFGDAGQERAVAEDGGKMRRPASHSMIRSA